MSSWATGPELMISTKRMDSSFGKNAANRVEESYGDAKNLRSRHPEAALGFLYGLGANALETEPEIARWLVDLLGKLGRESDAYDAVGLIIPHIPSAPDATSEEDPAGPLEAGATEALVANPGEEDAADDLSPCSTLGICSNEARAGTDCWAAADRRQKTGPQVTVVNVWLTRIEELGADAGDPEGSQSFGVHVGVGVPGGAVGERVDAADGLVVGVPTASRVRC